MTGLEEMLAKLAPDETQNFVPTVTPPASRWRYWSHAFNEEYDSQLMEPLTPTGEKWPGPARRGISYTSLDAYASGPLTFRGKREQLVDYYGWGSQVILISDRLHTLYRQLDPTGIESRPFTIEVIREGEREQYWAVMSARVLDAVDLDATAFHIENKPFFTGSARYFPCAHFWNGCVFRDEITNGVPGFVEYNVGEWVWSDELIDAFAAAKVRGFYANAPCRAQSSLDRIRL